MKFEISTYFGVNGIEFGTPRNEVRSKLGGAFKEFFKTPDSQIPTDSYDDFGVHVYYDLNFQLEAFEIFPPAQAIFKGRDLFSFTTLNLIKILEDFAPELEVDEQGFISRTLGFDGYSPQAMENPDDHCEGILVYSNTYWES